MVWQTCRHTNSISIFFSPFRREAAENDENPEKHNAHWKQSGNRCQKALPSAIISIVQAKSGKRNNGADDTKGAASQAQ